MEPLLKFRQVLFISFDLEKSSKAPATNLMKSNLALRHARFQVNSMMKIATIFESNSKLVKFLIQN